MEARSMDDSGELAAAAAAGGSVPRRSVGLLKKQLRLRKRRGQTGDSERFEIVPVEETLSFEKGFFLFIRAVQLLAQENEGVVLVGLAGPSGAGKTVFSEKVIAFMPGISLISMDNYNVASRVIDGNFDDPRITDYELLLDNIESLRNGKPAQVPIYDFRTSSRVGFKEVPVPPSRVVILEGIYALSERLRPMLDLRVSITGGVHFDLVKRVLRDIDRSGQPPQEIIAQISETVYPMYKAFIEPDLKTAHLRISNKFNPFSGFQNATYILKAPEDSNSTAEVIRALLSAGHKENAEETYDIYLLPPGEDKETCVSYLRMRNRDGRYSLMFEEWVTDGPFVITPRITFEVSVRLLGGLMALGYEMAHIIKRDSRVFKDDEHNVTIKIDRLEQLGKTYVQVQGKERGKVMELAQKLGMEGKFISKPYIEQIMLENLTKEVQAVAVPKNVLRERFRVSDELLLVSPHGSGSLISQRGSGILAAVGGSGAAAGGAGRIGGSGLSPSGGSGPGQQLVSASWSDGHGFHQQMNRSRSGNHWQPPSVAAAAAAAAEATSPDSLNVGGMDGTRTTPREGASVSGATTPHKSRSRAGDCDGDMAQAGQHHQRLANGEVADAVQSLDAFAQVRSLSRVGKQLQGVTERLDDLLSRIERIETRLLPAGSSPPGASASALSSQLATAGHIGSSGNGNGHGSGNGASAEASHVGASASAAAAVAAAAGTSSAAGGVASGLYMSSGGGYVMRGGRPSAERGSGGGTSPASDLTADVQVVARNQARIMDEIQQLSSMLRDSADAAAAAAAVANAPDVGSWWSLLHPRKTEAWAAASALAAIACAGVAVYTASASRVRNS